MTRSPSVLEELPDLALLELFSYLSSFDAGWLFARMNQRFHALVQERSFRCINWSPARSNQFDLLLNLLPLENVHSLAIDQEASQLQLLRWPRLPRLKALRIKGVWNSEHLQIFLLCHAPTLTDLIVEAYEEDLMSGFSRNTSYPKPSWCSLIAFIFRYLANLRSLNLSSDDRHCIRDTGLWRLVLTPLRSLRISIIDLDHLIGLMSTEHLSNTLEQLHVRVIDCDTHDVFPFGSLIRMKHLHTFTLAQDYFSSRPVSSTTIEQLVDMNVMPVLRRLNLAIFVRVDEMNRIGRFLRFNDQRRVMVHFALVTSYHRSHRKLMDLLPRGSIHHPREVVGVTFVVNRERMNVSKDPFVRDVFFFRLENVSS